MSETAAVGHAAKATAHEAIEVTVTYIAPLAAGVAGFFFSNSLGGVNSVYGVTQKIPGIGSNGGRVAGLVMALIWGGIGFVFWRMGKSGSLPMRFFGRTIGAFFLGAGAGQIPQIISPYAVPDGLLDNLTKWTSQVAGGQ